MQGLGGARCCNGSFFGFLFPSRCNLRKNLYWRVDVTVWKDSVSQFGRPDQSDAQCDRHTPPSLLGLVQTVSISNRTVSLVIFRRWIVRSSGVVTL